MKKIFAIVLTGILIGILLIGVYDLPAFGKPDNPANNYVAKRYIEKGVEETGALNIVAGVILDYRAFDTFGEAIVLFTAAVVVLVVLKKEN
ncbi:MAG: hydrogen gas-evolving membrane-bound hydrogenase subunit E [Clostridia bacterium]